MTVEVSKTNQSEIKEAIKQLKGAVAAKKCWSCGCFHNSLAVIEKAMVPEQRPFELDALIKAGHEHLAPTKYDCLGCDVCYGALIINSLNPLFAGCGGELEVCPSNLAEARNGWPPLPGAYTVLRYQAPVVICTLTDEILATTIVRNATPDIGIVGTLQTENLGIERLISNIIANPNIRFLILCGADSRQAVGHLPGQSFLALAHSGIDNNTSIIGAQGKRPILRNLAREAIDHFRHNVNVVDLIGNMQVLEIVDAARDCSGQNLGRAKPFELEKLLKPLTGYLPQKVIHDPAGYFVIYVDRNRQLLSLEHYHNDGLLDMVIEGKVAAELYTPAIEKGLVSRLDHAAYLGKELTRAERALASGNPFIQDAAPERKSALDSNQSCACRSSCKEVKL